MLRRQDGSVVFNRSWVDYERGFGQSGGEFWLGLESLHTMTAQGTYRLRVQMADICGTKMHAEYANFSIGSATTNYHINISGFDEEVSTAGDSLTQSDFPGQLPNGVGFSTYDRDNDMRPYALMACAKLCKGG